MGLGMYFKILIAFVFEEIMVDCFSSYFLDFGGETL